MGVAGYWLNATVWRLLFGTGGGGGPVDGFVLRQTKPDATNTGVGIIGPAPTTEWTGDYNVTTAGQVVENLTITGRVIVRAPNVTIRNCEIRIGAQTTNTYGVNIADPTYNTRIEYNTIHASNPSVWVSGIGVMGYTSYRNHIYDVVDGLRFRGSATGPMNASSQGDFIERLLYITPDPNHSDNRTHNDGIQVEAGVGGSVIGTHITGLQDSPYSTQPMPELTATSGIIITNPASNLIIEDNWLGGGAYTLSAGGGTSGPVITGHAYRNRFQGNSGRGVNIGISPNSPNFLTGDGTADQNFLEATLAPITASRNK